VRRLLGLGGRGVLFALWVWDGVRVVVKTRMVVGCVPVASDKALES
jgi:hypothetical protein